MKNHLLALRNLAERDANNDLMAYIDDLGLSLAPYEHQFRTGSPFLDAFLSEKAAESHQRNISFSAAIQLPAECPLKDSELSTLFGNILDNAIEGAAAVKESGERWIDVKSTEQAGRFFIVIRNSCIATNDEIVRHGLPATTKQDRRAHGFGLRSVQIVVKRHQGTLTAERQPRGRFQVVVSFPLHV